MNNKYLISASLGFFCVFSGSPLFATSGYFSLGYGAKSNGMAGATVAAPQDALVGAVNPAGIAWVGERVDVYLRAFNPTRKASLDPRGLGGDFKVEDKSNRSWFFIPGGGFTLPISENLWFGFTVYGNGGMNTSYSRNIYDQSSAVLGAFAVGGSQAAASVPVGTKTGTPNTGTLGVDLAQAIIAPTLSYRIHPKHTLGISALFGVQTFKAEGLGNFQCFTTTGSVNNPSACFPGGFGAATPGFTKSQSLTDAGRDWAYGAGVRVGWMGEIHPQVTLGGAVTSKIYMTRFDEYKELFAEQGGFDIPAHFQVGIAVRPLESLQLSFDFQRIFYGDVDSIANKGPIVSPFGPSIPAGFDTLGSDNGIGFGWKDINVYRLGAVYHYNKQFSFRTGYSWNESPIADDQVLFNIISPAVITQHASMGLSYRPDDGSEWSLTYMHAFHNSQNQQLSAFGVPASISMHQNSIELGYSWTY